MSPEIKSRMFEHGFFKGEQLEAFKEDLKNIVNIDTSRLSELIEFVKKIFEADTDKDELEYFNRAVDTKLVDKHATIISFYGITNFFFKKFKEEKNKFDDPEVIINDIAHYTGFAKDELTTIRILLELIKKEAKWYNNYILTKSTSVGLLPFLKGIGTTVELRGVFNRDIEYGEHIEIYKKDVEIIKENPVVPVITIALSLDSGTPDRFCFQSSPKRINWLIEELKAALHKLEILEETYKRK